MSSSPDSTKMPYKLSSEEIALYVSPMVGVGNRLPLSHKLVKRWVLENSEVVIYDGVGSFSVNGLRRPLDAQVAVRRVLPADMGGMMPRYLGDFTVRDTVFMVTELPKGRPPEDSTRLPEAALVLIALDRFFRKGWGERPLPDGIGATDMDFEGLVSVGKRLPEWAKRIDAIVGEMAEWPFHRLTERYPRGLMHGDPGVDNAFLSDESILFSGGPGEVGPELVDVAYFLQSAAASMDDFEAEPTVEALATFYKMPIETMRSDLVLADAAAHATVVRWFDRCSTELMPEFAELYDHLIGERLDALERLSARDVF